MSNFPLIVSKDPEEDGNEEYTNPINQPNCRVWASTKRRCGSGRSLLAGGAIVSGLQGSLQRFCFVGLIIPWMRMVMLAVYLRCRDTWYTQEG